jgi:ribosomal protein L11 methyltransferase
MIRHLPATNWAESWKKHFPALEIGSALLIRPEWIRRRPRTGQQLITLDPGLSFGTGHHPTTKFCLQELVRARPRKTARSMLDIGSGSGILTIAAAKLGFCPILAFDLDPVAVKVARANARRNDVERSVQIFQADLKMMGEKPEPYTVVCANLQTDLLIHQAPVIAGAVARGGRLVLAGILSTEMAQVRSVYEGFQLHPLRIRNGKEWSSVAFERP